MIPGPVIWGLERGLIDSLHLDRMSPWLFPDRCFIFCCYIVFNMKRMRKQNLPLVIYPRSHSRPLSFVIFMSLDHMLQLAWERLSGVVVGTIPPLRLLAAGWRRRQLCGPASSVL